MGGGRGREGVRSRGKWARLLHFDLLCLRLHNVLQTRHRRESGVLDKQGVGWEFRVGILGEVQPYNIMTSTRPGLKRPAKSPV